VCAPPKIFSQLLALVGDVHQPQAT